MKNLILVYVFLFPVLLWSQVIPERPLGDYLVTKSGDTIYVYDADVRSRVVTYKDRYNTTGITNRIKIDELAEIKVFDPRVIQLNKVDGRVEYQEVIEVPNTSAKDLYQNARLWFAETYKDSKEVLEMDDSDSGVLVGTGWSTFFSTVQLHLTTKIEVKEGRYRYTIYNMRVENPATSVSARYEDTVANYYTGRLSDRAKIGLLNSLQGHIDSLKEAMSSQPSSSDW